MKLDLRGAYITRAVAAGPHGCAEIITDGVQKTSDKIYAVFEDMSAADMPVKSNAAYKRKYGEYLSRRAYVFPTKVYSQVH